MQNVIKKLGTIIFFLLSILYLSGMLMFKEYEKYFFLEFFIPILIILLMIYFVPALQFRINGQKSFLGYFIPVALIGIGVFLITVVF